MPQASESQASGPIFGELEAIFGNDKPPRPIYRDDAIRNLERNLTSDIDIARGGLKNALAGYRRNLRFNQPLIRSATMESDSALRGILQRQSSPMSEYQQLGDYLFSKTQQVPDNVLRFLGNGLEVNNLARGLNPGAASSYETLLRGGLASRASLDANRASLGALVSAFPQLQSAIQGRDQTMMNILPQRLAGLENLSNRAMLPYQGLLAGLRDLQGLGMGQNQLNLGNLQGYHKDENWANKLGAAGRATGQNISQVLDWAGQAASIYGGLMGGGMGGMGGGGGGGGMSSLGSLFGGSGGSGRPNQYADLHNRYDMDMLRQNPYRPPGSSSGWAGDYGDVPNPDFGYQPGGNGFNNYWNSPAGGY